MRIARFVASLAPLAIFIGCSSNNVSSTAAGDVTSNGMEVRLIDAPNDSVKEIVVTLTRIDVHVAGVGWSSLVDKTQTVDLLKLQGRTYQSLGIGTIPNGHITQFRLYTSDAGPNYVTTPDGAQHPLKVPSGDESGIKLKAGFDLDPCANGYVTFDFDGKKSIFTHPLGAGAGDEWILRPVIRLHAVVAQGGCGGAPTGTPTSNPSTPQKPGSQKPVCNGGHDHTTNHPPTTPPDTDPPATTTPPATVSPPSQPSSTPPPTSEPPVSTTPPTTTTSDPVPPASPGDPCATAQCGSGTCFNGVCMAIVN